MILVSFGAPTRANYLSYARKVTLLHLRLQLRCNLFLLRQEGKTLVTFEAPPQMQIISLIPGRCAGLIWGSNTNVIYLSYARKVTRWSHLGLHLRCKLSLLRQEGNTLGMFGQRDAHASEVALHLYWSYDNNVNGK